MQAIVETGGKQYKVSQGQELNIEKILDKDVGDKVIFDKVLAIIDKDSQFGAPYVDYLVEGEVTDLGQGDKITGFKMKRRKNYKRKYGHRQQYLTVKILDIKKK